MELLFVTNNLPYPPSDGWRIRVFALIRRLARSHRISLVSFIRTTEDRAAAEGLRSYCADVRLIPRDPRYSPWKLLRGLVGSSAFSVLNYWDARMVAAIKSILQDRRFDLVQAESLQMAQYCTNLATRTVLDLHNIDSLVMKRYAERERNPLKRRYAELAGAKLARYEREICGLFSYCLTCSEDDQDRLRKQTGVERVAVVPNGVDLQAFQPDPSAATAKNKIVFVGRMDYHANVDGIRWFCREVFPLLVRTRPDLLLQIVGAHPTGEVRRLAIPGRVEVTGYVEDVRTFLRQATVVIIPLRIGGGTRLKILEALAMGKAVVSTTVGAEGIAARSGEEILLVDHAQGFAERIQKVLMDADLRACLGKAARQLVEVRYGWETIVGRLNQVYGECLAHPRHSSAPVGSTQLW